MRRLELELAGLVIGLRMNMFAKYELFMADKQIKNELFFITAKHKSKLYTNR